MAQNLCACQSILQRMELYIKHLAWRLSAYVTDAVFSEKHQAFLAAITAKVAPRSYKEAACDPFWNGVMGTEVTALEEHRTWDVTDLPEGKKALGC